VLESPPFPVMPTVPRLNIEFSEEVPQSSRASREKTI